MPSAIERAITPKSNDRLENILCESKFTTNIMTDEQFNVPSAIEHAITQKSNDRLENIGYELKICC